jgi:DNA-binding NtrC family response regulator
MKLAPKVHPLVERYCNSTDPLIELLKSTPQPREPAVEVTSRLYDSLTNPDDRDRVLGEAEELDGLECDPALYLFFLGARCIVSLRQERVAEARALARRAEALLSEDIPPELHAMVRRLPGTIAGALGDHEAFADCLAEATAIVPQSSPRRRELVFSRMDVLARRGELSEGEEELRKLEDTIQTGLRPSAGEIALVRFVDCVQAGRTAEAEALRGRIATPKGIVGFAAAEALPTLDLMLGRWDLDRPRTAEEERCWEQWPPVWAKSTRLLWERKPQQALELAREMEGSELTWVGFISYLLIRAELASGNGEAARRIIAMKRTQGGGHYLDNLFLARVGLLAGNRAAAAEHFALVASAVERYRARGRLDFELSLACELHPTDLLDLAGRAPATPSAAPAPAAAVGALSRRPGPGGTDGGDRGAERLVGQSRQIGEIRKQIRDFAAHEAAVLITGETGTGKELVARALHEESPRTAEPFLAVNCGAISESLLETELFGHERGAFTGAVRARKGLFEEAGRGTILLDEIGEIPPRLQVALLRVLETHEVRPVGCSRTRSIGCRVIAATNVNLTEMIATQRFRQDLYYRLAKLEVRMPALRERSEDILVLADLFLRRDRGDRRKPVMAEDLKEVLLAYRWPGNVRELRNEVERMRLLNSDGLSYELGMLSAAIREKTNSPIRPAPEPAREPERETGQPVGRENSMKAASAPDARTVEQIIDGGRSQLRRLARSRELFRKFQVLTRIELATTLGVSHDTVTRDLKMLCAEGLIEKVLPTASPRTHYFRLRPPSP